MDVKTAIPRNQFLILPMSEITLFTKKISKHQTKEIDELPEFLYYLNKIIILTKYQTKVRKFSFKMSQNEYFEILLKKKKRTFLIIKKSNYN